MINNGEIISAIQEERLSRKKHDCIFPKNAILYCLESKKIDLSDVDHIFYYEKPLLTFERLLETYIETAPRGLRSFIASMRVWLKEKLFLKSELKNELNKIQKRLSPEKEYKVNKVLFSEHHLSLASSASEALGKNAKSIFSFIYKSGQITPFFKKFL